MAPGQPDSTRERLSRLAWLLDSSMRVPGTDFRIGLDALLGLVPGAGDALGMLLSGYIVLGAARAGAPRSVLLRMILNIAVEGIAGAVPVAGDLFDAAWKANQRNVALLNDWLDRPGPTVAASRSTVALVMGALGLLIVLVLALLYLVARSLGQAW